MSLSNIQVYDREIAGNTIQLLGQMLDKFNAASLNAIQLSMARWEGNYTKESFYQEIASAQRRVDRYAANAAQASTDLTQGEMVGVKVAGGFGPVLFEPGQLSWMQRDPGEAVMVIAEGFANALLADQLNTALLAGVAAIENQPTLVNDVSGTPSGVTQVALNNTHRLFGDRSSDIIVDVMSGDVYHRLVNEALNNSNRLFEAGNVQVVDILGKRGVITDSPALYEAGTPNKDKVLALTNGAIIVDNAGDIITNLEQTNGKQRIETTWQADYTFGLKVKGYSWDTANGGASPEDAELATGTNWDPNFNDKKFSAGALLVASADA